jgi:hypothetical protein
MSQIGFGDSGIPLPRGSKRTDSWSCLRPSWTEKSWNSASATSTDADSAAALAFICWISAERLMLNYA